VLLPPVLPPASPPVLRVLLLRRVPLEVARARLSALRALRATGRLAAAGWPTAAQGTTAVRESSVVRVLRQRRPPGEPQ
jgi:hypothetical protein